MPKAVTAPPMIAKPRGPSRSQSAASCAAVRRALTGSAWIAGVAGTTSAGGATGTRGAAAGSGGDTGAAPGAACLPASAAATRADLASSSARVRTDD